MLVRVLKPFRDKHTKRIYGKGIVIDITKERFDEICGKLGKGFVEPFPEETSEVEAAPPKRKRPQKAGEINARQGKSIPENNLG